MAEPSDRSIRVLHVEDDKDIAELTATFLERTNSDMEVVTEHSAPEGLERLDDIDCVVSDYNMPGMDGIELLQKTRIERPDLPFILFTGRGSEEIASEAISAGVTDYLQKKSGTDQFTLLANRIENAVAQHRAVQEVKDTRRWYSTLIEHSSDFVSIVDPIGTITYVSSSVKRVMGYEPEVFVGTDAFSIIHPDDLEKAEASFGEVLEHPEQEITVEFRARHADGTWIWLEVRGRNLLDDPIINGIMVNVRNITARKEREQELERQNERFEEFTRFISHDLRNQQTVITGRLELTKTEFESDHLDAALRAVDRVNMMIENLEQLAEGGQIPPTLEPVNLATIAEECWRNVMIKNAELQIEGDVSIDVDEERFRSLLENLFRNAVDHGDESVVVSVGTLADSDGFYVEDSGPGIPADAYDRVFEPGYSTSVEGTGFGLSIVKQIAEAHGWTITLTEGSSGGSRFEFTFSDIPAE